LNTFSILAGVEPAKRMELERSRLPAGTFPMNGWLSQNLKKNYFDYFSEI
jgi:hypothetical protein